MLYSDNNTAPWLFAGSRLFLLITNCAIPGRLGTIIIIIIIGTPSQRWTVALFTSPDHQPLSRPTEQLNVSLSERHVTRNIAAFLAFFANQKVVPCRHVTQPTLEGRHVLQCFLAGVSHVRTEPAFCHWWLHVCLVDLSFRWLPSWLQSLTTGCL